MGGTANDPTISLKLDNTSPISFSQSASGLKAMFNSTAGDQLIDEVDKVLGISPSSALYATLGLTYDNGTKKINLTGKSNAVIATIDATDFIKDGMVQNVELEGNNLVFTFNTDAGKDVVSVDLSKFIDVYEAGGGIIISGKTIAVKVGAGDKYLINKSGALYSQGIDEAIEAAITEALSWHEA